MQIDRDVLAILNEDKLISILIPIKLYNKDPYTTELYIKKDKESGIYKTEVFDPEVLGRHIEIVASTMDELRAKLVDYYQSINYDVDFEEGTAAYLTDDEQIVNKAFTESKNEAYDWTVKRIIEHMHSFLDKFTLQVDEFSPEAGHTHPNSPSTGSGFVLTTLGEDPKHFVIKVWEE